MPSLSALRWIAELSWDQQQLVRKLRPPRCAARVGARRRKAGCIARSGL